MITHPGVESAGPKERHFFDRTSAVSSAPRTSPLITGSSRARTARSPASGPPRYMYDPWTPPLIAEAAPEAKILVLLEIRISRFPSGVGHESRVLKRELRGGRRDHC